MKEIRTEDAAGHVLCHDITRIVRGGEKGVAFAKGHVVAPEDIPELLKLGKEHLFVWEKQAGMLHENEAAAVLYGMCAGPGMHGTAPREGKIEVVADVPGLLRVDVEKLRAVNTMPGLMIATRRTNCPVRAGDVLAGTRIIPLVIEAARMQAAQKAAGPAPLLEIAPYVRKTYGVVTTGSEVQKGLIEDTFTPVLRDKMAAFGMSEVGHALVGDDAAATSAAILGMIENGAEVVLCSGGMSVDPDDRTPLAIKNTGAHVVAYGAPVLPGAMFMLAYGPGGVPVLGLPGCVMYSRRTIFDLVLPRVLANVPVTGADLAALGHGGLCLNCEACIFPNCGFGAGV